MLDEKNLEKDLKEVIDILLEQKEKEDKVKEDKKEKTKENLKEFNLKMVKDFNKLIKKYNLTLENIEDEDTKKFVTEIQDLITFKLLTSKCYIDLKSNEDEFNLNIDGLVLPLIIHTLSIIDTLKNEYDVSDEVIEELKKFVKRHKEFFEGEK